MDSDNRRVRREPSKEEDDVSGNNARREAPQQSSFSGWGGVPSYRDRQLLYQEGSNPTRGRYVAPALRRTGPIAKDPKSDQALEEGRRIYVGNLPYAAQIADIRDLFIHVEDSIQDINMPVDPLTGQNPSYCFVDFTSKAGANKALQNYDGMKFMGRHLKVNTAFRTGDGKGHYHLKRDLQETKTDSSAETPTGGGDINPYAFNRWRRESR